MGTLRGHGQTPLGINGHGLPMRMLESPPTASNCLPSTEE